MVEESKKTPAKAPVKKPPPLKPLVPNGKPVNSEARKSARKRWAKIATVVKPFYESELIHKFLLD